MLNAWQFSVYHLPILTNALVSAILSMIAWRYREYRYSGSLLILLSAVTWWSLMYVVELGATIPALKRLASSLVYPATAVASIAWFVFTVQYTDMLRVPTKREFAGLGIVPAVTTAAALTNQYHGLLWESVDVVSTGQLDLLVTSPGVLFWVYALHSYALVSVGTALIVVMVTSFSQAHRLEGTMVILAAAFPLVVSLLHLTGVTTAVDLTPMALALSGTVLVTAAFRDQLLQSLPLVRGIARSELIRKMTNPVVVVDKQARVVDANPAAKALTDGPTDVIGAHIESAFPDVADVIELREDTSHRSSFLTSEAGTEQCYKLETHPLRYGSGVTRGHLVNFQEVTEVKTRQKELAQERQFIGQALDALDDLFYVLEVDGHLERWNEQFMNVTGYDDSELDEMHALEYFPDDDRRKVADAIERTLQTGETTVEADLLTADGERIPHEFTGARLEDEDGRATGLVGVARDISERKARERRLRTFREAVENAGRMIYWLDSDFTVEHVNPTFEAQTKYDAAELVGTQTPPLADNAQSEAVLDDMVETLSNGETWKSEFTIRRDDGERRTVNQSVTPVYNDGDLERFVAVAGDITERKRRKQQLSVLRRILRHDLRNNLNMILLSVQLAKREITSDSVRQRLDGAEQTIEETLALSQDVKQFRQAFESGDAGNRVVDIVEVTREQLETIRAEGTNVDVSVELSGTARVVTNNLIGRAIRNVLRNAIEHNDAAPPEVTIALTRQQSDDAVELQIADNGPGIPEETIEVLRSEREEQLDHLDGFGLWLVHWVVTLSGGSLEFAENAPRGTVVKLVLPLAEQDNRRLVMS